MIGKQIIGKNFTKLLNYLFSKEGASLIGSNMMGKTPQELAVEFRSFLHLNNRVQKPVYHAALSIPKSEALSDAQWLDIGLDYLKGMGFDQNQFAIFRHTDCDHDHIHIAASRIKLNIKGNCVSDSWNYRRSEKLIEQLEEKYGLTPTVRSWEKERRSPTTGECRQLARTGETSAREQLQTVLDQATIDQPEMTVLVDRLTHQGISVRIKPTPRQELGISYKLGDVAFSGTHLGKSYTFKGLQKYRGVRYYSNLNSEEIEEIFSGSDNSQNSQFVELNNTSFNDLFNPQTNPDNLALSNWTDENPVNQPVEDLDNSNFNLIQSDSIDDPSIQLTETIQPTETLENHQQNLTSPWQLLRERLIENSSLPSELIDLLHDKGWINADEHNRAVFTLRTLAGEDRGTCTLESNGKFSINPDLKMPLAKTEDDETGIFWIATQHNIERAIITSDPIETLSAIALDPDFNIRPTLYLSIDDPSSLPIDFLRDIPTIIVGLKGDEFREQVSQEIIEIVPQAQRINPGIGGWNQLLINSESEINNSLPETDQTRNLVQQELEQWTQGINLN